MVERPRRGETLQELSASLGVSYDSLWRAASDGRLKVIRLGKRIVVPMAEVERVTTEGLRPAAASEAR